MFKEGQNISDTHLLTRDMLVDAVKEAKVIKFKGDGRFGEKQKKIAA
jgi:hypothetical protein